MQQDYQFKCIGCGEDTTIRAQEANFILSRKDADGKPYTLPKRCKACREAKKARFAEKERLQRQLPDRARTDEVLNKLADGETVTL